MTGSWAVLFDNTGSAVAKRADPTAHDQIARRPLHSFKLIHPAFMGKTAWFRRHLYRADAIRCEDHDLLFRTHASSCFANVPEILLGYRQTGIDWHKSLRSRWTWWRSTSRYLNLPRRLRVGAVEAVKSCRDVLAVALHADTTLLKARYLALTDQELQEWRRVWDSVS